MVFYVYATLQSCVSSQILLYMHEIVLQVFLVLYIWKQKKMHQKMCISVLGTTFTANLLQQHNNDVSILVLHCLKT